jgi:hypothetical protein
LLQLAWVREIAYLRKSAEQLIDEDIQPVIKWMEESSKKPSWEEIAPHNLTTKLYCTQWQSLKLPNGVLYRICETPSGVATVLQLVLPKSLRHEVLQQLHNTKTSGHLGVAKTLARKILLGQVQTRCTRMVPKL